MTISRVMACTCSPGKGKAEARGSLRISAWNVVWFCLKNKKTHHTDYNWCEFKLQCYYLSEPSWVTQLISIYLSIYISKTGTIMFRCYWTILKIKLKTKGIKHFGTILAIECIVQLSATGCHFCYLVTKPHTLGEKRSKYSIKSPSIYSCKDDSRFPIKL